MKRVDVGNQLTEVNLSFDWQRWKDEVVLSKSQNRFDVEGLREKYAEFDSESRDAFKMCNAVAKIKCKAIISGQKVHMLASLPHEKHIDTFDWNNWLKSGLKALNKRMEHTEQSLIKEVVNAGQMLPMEDQKLYAECMEHFLLNGLKKMYNGFHSDLTYELKDVINLSVSSERIKAWATAQNSRVIEFFY